MKKKAWITLHSKVVLNNPWYLVKQETVKLPNGVILDDYYLGELPDVAVIFPITDQNEVVFVRQYRHGTKEVLLELPAGTFVRGKEQPQTAARRELLEETGYRAQELIKLAAISEYPTKNTHLVNLFLARGVKFVGGNTYDVSEDIEVKTYPIAEVENLVLSGKVKVAGSITAIFLALNYLKQH